MSERKRRPITTDDALKPYNGLRPIDDYIAAELQEATGERVAEVCPMCGGSWIFEPRNAREKSQTAHFGVCIRCLNRARVNALRARIADIRSFRDYDGARKEVSRLGESARLTDDEIVAGFNASDVPLSADSFREEGDSQ